MADNPSTSRRWGCKLLLVAFMALAGYAGYEVITYPDVTRLSRENPKTTAWMEIRAREARAKGKKTTAV
jgi:hypothetical protein